MYFHAKNTGAYNFWLEATLKVWMPCGLIPQICRMLLVTVGRICQKQTIRTGFADTRLYTVFFTSKEHNTKNIITHFLGNTAQRIGWKHLASPAQAMGAFLVEASWSTPWTRLRNWLPSVNTCNSIRASWNLSLCANVKTTMFKALGIPVSDKRKPKHRSAYKVCTKYDGFLWYLKTKSSVSGMIKQTESSHT